MRSLLVLGLVVSGPAVAQLGPTPSSADRMAFGREQQAASELNRGGSDKFAYDRDEGRARNARATILRAGAWGRCVAAKAPELSRAYVTTRSADPALRPVFSTCLRRTGDFTGSNWGDVRRAALTDALAAAERPPAPAG